MKEGEISLSTYTDYWKIKNGKYKESICIGNNIIVDVDKAMKILGVEYLK